MGRVHSTSMIAKFMTTQYRYETPTRKPIYITLPPGVAPPELLYTDKGEAKFMGYTTKEGA